MRSLLLILAMIPTVAAADVVMDLVGKDAATRARAKSQLLRRGTPALTELRKAEAESTDETAKVRITEVIRAIEKREPGGLLFRCGLPKMKLTVETVRSREFKFAVTVKNRGDETRILYPYLSLRLLDAKGQPVRYSRHLGRGGRRRSRNKLESVKFVTLKPGESWQFQDGIAQYMHDASWINGWKIPAAGNYTLEFTYAFDREAAKKSCDPAWDRLHAPNEPWNRALAITHAFTTPMVVEA